MNSDTKVQVLNSDGCSWLVNARVRFVTSVSTTLQEEFTLNYKAYFVVLLGIATFVNRLRLISNHLNAFLCSRLGLCMSDSVILDDAWHLLKGLRLLKNDDERRKIEEFFESSKWATDADEGARDYYFSMGWPLTPFNKMSDRQIKLYSHMIFNYGTDGKPNVPAYWREPFEAAGHDYSSEILMGDGMEHIPDDAYNELIRYHQLFNDAVEALPGGPNPQKHLDPENHENHMDIMSLEKPGDITSGGFEHPHETAQRQMREEYPHWGTYDEEFQEHYGINHDNRQFTPQEDNSNWQDSIETGEPMDIALRLLKEAVQHSILTNKPHGVADYDALLEHYRVMDGEDSQMNDRKIKPDYSNVGVRKVPVDSYSPKRQYRHGKGDYSDITDIYEPYMTDTDESLGEMTMYDGNKVAVAGIDNDVQRQGLYDKVFRTALKDKGSITSQNRVGPMSSPFHDKLRQELPQEMSSSGPQEMRGEQMEQPINNPNKHAKTGGLNAKGRAAAKRKTGANLKRPVTKKPSSLKPGGKAAGRRKSFCARMSGVKGPTSKEGKKTPKGAALARWNC